MVYACVCVWCRRATSAELRAGCALVADRGIVLFIYNTGSSTCPASLCPTPSTACIERESRSKRCAGVMQASCFRRADSRVRCAAVACADRSGRLKLTSPNCPSSAFPGRMNIISSLLRCLSPTFRVCSFIATFAAACASRCSSTLGCSAIVILLLLA